MSGIALLLVLLGAVSHAGWNLAAKSGSGSGVAFVWFASLISAVAVTPFAVAALINGQPLGWQLLLGGGVSGLLHAGYFLLLQQAYRLGDVSMVYPLARGTGPLLTMIISIAVLGERPSPVSLTGALVVIAGVAVIGFFGGRGVQLAPGAVGFGLTTGVAIACYTLWDSYSVTRLAISPMVQSWLSSLVVVIILLPWALRVRGALRSTITRHTRSALIVGIGSPLAYISIMYAMRLAPTALVAPGREVSVVLVGLAGWLLLHEPNPRPRLIGAAVVLVGIVLIAVGG
ncbi:MAG TPA: EamA family transporter [Microlunatus sp.]